MTRVLQTSGRLIAAATTGQVFNLPPQGRKFKIRRVFATFTNDGAENRRWYFSLVHLNGEGAEIARTSTTKSENPSDYAAGMDEGAVHFFAEVEFRSHQDGVAVRGGAGLSQLMTAPVGCDGYEVDTGEHVSLYWTTEEVTGLAANFTLGTIYWHCEFEDDKPEKR